MAKAGNKDRQQVVDKATNLYWQKGFHGTSMRNLQDVIDMRPGSIYAAFGSKEGLFKEALQNYARHGELRLQELKQSSGSPLLGLKIFVENAVICSQKDAPNGMCMLAKTISELTEENHSLLHEAQRLLNEMEALFAMTFEEAQAAGEIDSDKDTKQLASYLQVQIMGLRCYARASSNKQIISDMIDKLFASF